MTRQALEVHRSDRMSPIGYVGISDGKNWPLVDSLEKAAKWSTNVLADGASSQYLSYLRQKYPRDFEKYSLKRVLCD